MSDRPDAWGPRRRAWRIERLTPSLERLPERHERFTTLGDLPGRAACTARGTSRPTRTARRRRTPTTTRAPAARPRSTTTATPLREGAGRYADATSVRDIGLPGEPPFTRGIHPTGYRSRPWTMRMFAGFGRAEDTNARFRQLLAAGQTGLSIAYDMPTLYGYDTDDPEAEGEFGTCGVAVSSLADMEALLDGLPLDRVSTSMTINSPAAPIWAMYIVAAEKAGVPRGRARGHDPERHPQGVRRPEGVPVPARAVDAPRRRHDRVRDARAAALEHGLDQRLPHPRGGLDRRPGAGVHDRRRHGLRGGGDRARPAGRRLRAAPLVLLQQPQRLLRGDRQVPGLAPDLVEADERALPRRERALDLDALPHPDRRRARSPRSSRSTT